MQTSLQLIKSILEHLTKSIYNNFFLHSHLIQGSSHFFAAILYNRMPSGHIQLDQDEYLSYSFSLSPF